MNPLALLVLPAALAAPGPAVQAATEARWHLVESPAVLEQRARKAVDAVVSEMNPLYRAIARRRLGKLSGTCLEYRFELTDTTFTHECTGYPPVVAPLSGAQASYTKADGEVVQLRLQLEGDAMIVRFTGDNGGQTSTFRFSEGEVHHHRRIDSEYLPEPLILEARYAR